MELHKLAGRLQPAMGLLDARSALATEEMGWANNPIRQKAYDLHGIFDRIVAIADLLGEGPIERFGREHPMFLDVLDGPYCGAESCSRPSDVEAHEWNARHWDAWELRGTGYQRPLIAVRPTSE